MGEKVEGQKKAAAEGGEKKAPAAPAPAAPIVLKLDLHCEGCAKKVRRSISHFEVLPKIHDQERLINLVVVFVGQAGCMRLTSFRRAKDARRYKT